MNFDKKLTQKIERAENILKELKICNVSGANANT